MGEVIGQILGTAVGVAISPVPVIAVILIITVVQEEISKRYGYEELVCQERDLDCLALLCPQGWVYRREEDQCHLAPGDQNLHHTQALPCPSP